MKQFGKVAVLMGGWSAEREVSLKSGKAVMDALLNKGVNAVAIDANRDIHHHLSGFDRVFNIMHGRGGEDGVIQGLLEIMQIPYTGSGVLGSALCMDKLLTKQLWKGTGLPTPDYRILDSAEACNAAVRELGLPLMIKPVLEGSSIGMSKVTISEQIVEAWQLASKYCKTVIAEKFIKGAEYTAAILGQTVLPMIRLETPRNFYDYKAKYDDDATRYHCPCGLSADKEKQLAELVLQSFNAVHAEGWGRVDFMLDEQHQPWLIEVNTVPGMTDHSLVPMAARQAGLAFDDLVIQILKGTLD
ncbi:MAG: D-alanine--D-alanine ligase [Gammaproteobacteria bacterium]|nr:MAG: D-alanine--D-alanine ligase [Gammaproteobacteria bacterium]